MEGKHEIEDGFLYPVLSPKDGHPFIEGPQYAESACFLCRNVRSRHVTFSTAARAGIASALWSVYNDPELRDMKQVDRVLNEFIFVLGEDDDQFDSDAFREEARKFQ